MKREVAAGLVAVFMLASCATISDRPGSGQEFKQRDALYGMTAWEFTGRLALTSGQDSWSASISWRHNPTMETIKLAGPLGQGATVIELTDGMVKIDKGGGDVEVSEQPEALVSQKLGMFVPLRSLAYWVLGLVRPGQDSQQMEQGFLQDGWYVDFREVQEVGVYQMPRKMTVMKDKIKLKLIIDHWELHNVAATR